MKQKKLMLLGGIRYLLPVIKAAHEQGYYVITADYLPDNIAHKYSIYSSLTFRCVQVKIVNVLTINQLTVRGDCYFR